MEFHDQDLVNIPQDLGQICILNYHILPNKSQVILNVFKFSWVLWRCVFFFFKIK